MKVSNFSQLIIHGAVINSLNGFISSIQDEGSYGSVLLARNNAEP